MRNAVRLTSAGQRQEGDDQPILDAFMRLCRCAQSLHQFRGRILQHRLHWPTPYLRLVQRQQR